LQTINDQITAWGTYSKFLLQCGAVTQVGALIQQVSILNIAQHR